MRWASGHSERTMCRKPCAKMATLSDLDSIEWHLIGPLQGNKARLAAANFAWVQTIDRLADRRTPRRGAGRLACRRSMSAFRSTSAARPSKSGCAPEAALSLAQAVARLPRLALRGFMGDRRRDRSIPRSSARSFVCCVSMFDRAQAHGATRRYLVDGHVGGPGSGDRRGQHAGRASAARCSARVREKLKSESA